MGRGTVSVESRNKKRGRHLLAVRRIWADIHVNGILGNAQFEAPLLGATRREVAHIGRQVYISELTVVIVLQVVVALAEIEVRGEMAIPV
jgi:hypothetical protein